MLSRLVSFIALTLAIVTCVNIGGERSARERGAWNKLALPPGITFAPKVVEVATLGHRGLYDDLVGIWILQMLADPALKTYASADDLKNYLKTALRILPKLESLYLLSCFTLALDYDEPEFCEELSYLGLKAFPDSWRIPMTQGFISSFSLGDNAKAAVFYGIASTRPKSPPWVANLASRLANKTGTDQQDLNETLQVFANVAGGTKLIELLRDRLKFKSPTAVKPDPDVESTTEPKTP